ncbi:uncharacterized protein RMCN_1088 [Mycolicibacterium novocastrense]|uniref:Uncharacterized protein n=1 Tax=Mycolicibacterium novocastrense TaxID=59813 RepID=A0ABQ0KEH6_MYCNV|nr:uncharacterized protein RMCN_1088 [Mycolicibacterium novocastrense]
MGLADELRPCVRAAGRAENPPAHVTASFEDANIDAPARQLVGRNETGEAGTDNYDVAASLSRSHCGTC